MESVADVTEAGTEPRLNTDDVSVVKDGRGGKTYRPEPYATGKHRQSKHIHVNISTYKTPVVSNCAAHTPPPLLAKSSP